MASTSSTVVNMPQLTSSSNFNNWKFRVRTILEERQLSSALINTEADFTADRDKNDFKLKDAKVKSIIVQCLTDKYLDLVKDSKTAKDMMKALQDVFERKSVFTKLTLKRRLLTLKLSRNDKLEDHFMVFDTLIRDLENAGSKMEEEDKVCHLLLSLNDEYEYVITAIETMNTDVTMDFVKSRLLDEEIKGRAKQGQNVNNEMSFYACYKCGKSGHKFSECRQNATKGYSRGNFSRRRSYNKNCFQNTRGNSSGYNRHHEHPSQQQTRANKADEITFIALSATPDLKNVNSFILDSGCTQHMVMGEVEKYMTDIKEIETVKIGTAKNNQVLYANRAGTVKGFCQGREIKI